ncbi:MAG TPA: glucosyl-3-phosphoglycerate synthase [Thermoleophilaceae bacterium]|nr:glucosyl-3-phosphoglycerate synthase [Thermoleophilaceae bacterium]
MRSYHHSQFGAARAVSVCIPVREEAGTIGGIVESLLDSVDQVVVVDASSSDGSAAIAAGAGAEVYDQSELLPEFGELRGKGDAMWRSLTVLRNEIVCFVDGDSLDFGPHFVHGLVGPLFADPSLRYVKGFYRRPFGDQPEGGGRVTELTARPLLRLFYPELAECRQPLAGEIAARRSLLESIPWATGYGIEIAQLIDVYREVGIDAMAQVDLDVRRNRHQPLSALGAMASDVAAALATRLAREGRLTEAPAVLERPPLRSLRAAA